MRRKTFGQVLNEFVSSSTNIDTATGQSWIDAESERLKLDFAEIMASFNGQCSLKAAKGKVNLSNNVAALLSFSQSYSLFCSWDMSCRVYIKISMSWFRYMHIAYMHSGTGLRADLLIVPLMMKDDAQHKNKKWLHKLSRNPLPGESIFSKSCLY